MKVIDTVVYMMIAVMYAVFMYNIGCYYNRDETLDVKMKNNAVFLIVGGIFGLCLSKIVVANTEKYNNKIVERGLFVGGLLLISFSVITNWEIMTDEIKLVSSGVGLLTLLWYSYSKN